MEKEMDEGRKRTLGVIAAIACNGFEPWGMYDHIKRYPWVLPIVLYENRETLLTALPLKVIAPAEAKAKEQAPKKN
jgi:hypothetical protein